MILVVDDNPAINDLIATVCEEIGVAKEFAATGEEALILAGQKSYDLILMDLHLEGLCGVEAAISIRQLPEPYGSVPIVALTGLIPVRGMAKWDAAGFVSTLVKPFSVKALISAIRKYSRPPKES